MCSILHKSVSEFRAAVASESSRLTDLCFTWRNVIEQDAALDVKALSEEVLGDINVAIGQAELLKKERFKQFTGLIDNCEFGRGEKETTLQDLQGFWDVVYFQVDDILQKFTSLNKLRNNSWQVEHAPLPALTKAIHPNCVKKLTVSVPTSSAVTKKQGRPAASSSIRAHILAARSKMVKMALTEKSVPKVLVPSKSPVIVLQPHSADKKNAIPANVTPTKPKCTHKCDKENIDIYGGSTLHNSNVEMPHEKLVGTNTTKGESVDCTRSKESSRLSVKAAPIKQAASPQMNTFDAGFFKIETPCKSKPLKKTAPVTPGFNTQLNDKGGRVLSSTVLRERVRLTPLAHKDYSPCMRITRSMKEAITSD